MTIFRDRTDAGRQLAARLVGHRGTDAVVLALPRGGVPVAVEVARALLLPLDVLVVRKLGSPGQPELGMGAVSEGGAFYLDRGVVADVGATSEEIEETTVRELTEVERRVRGFRGGRPLLAVSGKTAIVVDDGIATGGTVHAALRALRSLRPRHVVVAVPVAPMDTLENLAELADEIVCLAPVERLGSVGAWYEDFEQVDDDVVFAQLSLFADAPSTRSSGAHPISGAAWAQRGGIDSSGRR
jgi:putative phosphoribosyl transferase